MMAALQHTWITHGLCVDTFKMVKLFPHLNLQTCAVCVDKFKMVKQFPDFYLQILSSRSSWLISLALFCTRPAFPKNSWREKVLRKLFKILSMMYGCSLYNYLAIDWQLNVILLSVTRGTILVRVYKLFTSPF